MVRTCDTRAKLREITVKISIEGGEGVHYWATGFFISKRPVLALTAYHNLPESYRENPRQANVRAVLRGFLKDETEIYFDILPKHSSEDQDIATLMVSGGPWSKKATAYLKGKKLFPVAIYRTNDEIKQIQFWAGRAVNVFGYPTKGYGQEPRLICSRINASEPYFEPDEKDFSGARSGKQYEFLSLPYEKVVELKGLSGSALLDATTNCIVGVQHSIDPDRKAVFCSELKWIVDDLKKNYRDIRFTELKDSEPVFRNIFPHLYFFFCKSLFKLLDPIPRLFKQRSFFIPLCMITLLSIFLFANKFSEEDIYPKKDIRLESIALFDSSGKMICPKFETGNEPYVREKPVFNIGAVSMATIELSFELPSKRDLIYNWQWEAPCVKMDVNTKEPRNSYDASACSGELLDKIVITLQGVDTSGWHEECFFIKKE